MDFDNFEEYLEKPITKTLMKSMLNIDSFLEDMDYSIVVNEYIYDAIDIGTGQFIQKKKKTVHHYRALKKNITYLFLLRC